MSLVSRLADAYRTPPHEVLLWDPWEMTVNAIVMQHRDRQRARAIRDAKGAMVAVVLETPG